MTICIVGDIEDLTAVYLAWLAKKRDFDVLNLSEDKLGVEWSFAFDDQDMSSSLITVNDRSFKFSDIDGAFVRFSPEPSVPVDISLQTDEFTAFVMERRAAIQYLLNSAGFPVVNRPYSGRSNGTKPFQMKLLEDAGFHVPKWLTTNDEAVAREFANQCPDGVVYKACSGLRSRVRILNDSLMERFRNGTTPVVLQEYIKGRDIRVHTINKKAFPTEAVSHGIDYRFDTEGNKFEIAQIPTNIERLCHKMAEKENLVIAGFDFRATEQGKWYCLEVNPVPTFLPYEMATGQAIGNEILDFFLHP